MYTEGLLDLSWGAQLTIVRLVLLSQFTLVLISAVRFVKSARRLYRSSGERILPENVLKGEADPDLLAESALASQLPCKADLESNPEFFKTSAGAEQVRHALRMAESRFRYLWERCHADVESARRASLITFLLSLVMVAYSAFPMFNHYFNSSKRIGSMCLFLTAAHLLVLLALGWSCCTVLYFASSFFERKLADRKASWKYFCSRLKNELLREVGGF